MFISFLTLYFLLYTIQCIHCQLKNDPKTVAIPDTEKTRQILANFITDDLQSTKTQHIRAKYEDGCLDGGCCQSSGWNWVHTQKGNKCPDYEWLKWRMDGHHFKFNSHENDMSFTCLDIITNGSQNGTVISIECDPKEKSQEWEVKLFPGQITLNDSRQRVYFSIESRLHVGQCLHILDNEDNSTNSIFGERPSVKCENMESVCLFLAKCTGEKWQSFYLGRLRWKEYVKHLKVVNCDDCRGKLTLEPASQFSYIVYIACGIGFCFLIALLATIFFWMKYRRTKKTLRNLTRQEVDEFLKGSSTEFGTMDNWQENAVHAPYNKKFEIQMSNLVIDENDVLGRGAYGLVFRGNLKTKNSNLPIAAKTTRPDADTEHFKALLAEIKIMAYVGKHENIVEFLGAVTNKIKQGSVYVVVELSPLGNLQIFLKKHRDDFSKEIDRVNYYLSLTEPDEKTQLLNESPNPSGTLKRLRMADLLHFSYQIANGMEYLASKGVLHGDLAIRNVLVFDKGIVKITDFGLSRKLHYQHYIKTSHQSLPFRWMAPESLNEMIFSTQSDVWAFAISIWEIFSLAEIPYSGVTFTREFIKTLQDGFRLHRPRLASPEIYKEMSRCWNADPELRPTFIELKQIFKDMSNSR